jgi:hypothetical protein
VDITAELENAESSGAYGIKQRAATSSQLRHALHSHAWLKSHEIKNKSSFLAVSDFEITEVFITPTQLPVSDRGISCVFLHRYEFQFRHISSINAVRHY